MSWRSRRSFLASLLACCVACSSCSQREIKTELVNYNEFGPEFLPSVIALYEQPLSQAPNVCSMVYVLYFMEARIPTEADESHYMQALTLSEGVTAEGKPQWRFTMVQQTKVEGKIKWEQTGRPGYGSEPSFSGAQLYPAKPTLAELETFVERARLQVKVDFYYILLDACGDPSHRYVVRAKTYDQELNELYGQVPEFLRKYNQERFADDPKPESKKKTNK
jgi:hypothetical protein